MRLKNKAGLKSRAAVGCFCLIAFLCLGPSILADRNQTFMALVKEIRAQNIIVAVDNGLVSDRAPVQVVSLLITEKTIFKDSTLKVMTLKAFTSKAFADISFVEVQSTTLPGGVVRADVIIILAGR